MELLTFTLINKEVSINFYGLMYVISFIFGYYFLKKQIKIKIEPYEDLFFYCILGVIFGGRLGYIIFYNFSYYFENPSQIFAVWNGGMSFHGGLLGVIFAIFLFHKKYKIPFFRISDSLALAFPIGLFFGRIGNYVNKELLGKEYYGPLAVKVGEKSYFPSPLLEAFLEGLILWFILLLIYNKKYKSENIVWGYLSAYFLIFYAIFRIFVEYFFRLPDSHLGYIFANFSLGSILSFAMFLAGIIILIYIKKQQGKNL